MPLNSRLNEKIIDMVDKLVNNKGFKNNVLESYIFGSSVQGCSSNPFTNESDIDIAIKPKNANIDSIENIKVHEVINDIFWKRNGRNYDIIWINDNLEKQGIYQNILKGERII